MNAKALMLLLLRCSVGIYLTVWGVNKLLNANGAVRLSDTYYFGLISDGAVVSIVGILQIIVGLAVAIGIFRKFSYVIHAAFWVVSTAPIILYLLDPLALYLVDQGRLTWFPSTTLVISSFLIIVFKEFDTMSLDNKLGK